MSNTMDARYLQDLNKIKIESIFIKVFNKYNHIKNTGDYLTSMTKTPLYLLLDKYPQLAKQKDLINSIFSLLINNIFNQLEDTKWWIRKNNNYEDKLLKYKSNIYEELIKFYTQIHLPRIINHIISELNSTTSLEDINLKLVLIEDYIKQNFDIFYKEAFNILDKYLTNIYHQFGTIPNNLIDQEIKNTKLFTDFDNDDLANAFKILELDESATIKIIKQQYKKLALKYHPDKNSSHDKMSQLNQAYQIIKEHLER